MNLYLLVIIFWLENNIGFSLVAIYEEVKKVRVGTLMFVALWMWKLLEATSTLSFLLMMLLGMYEFICSYQMIKSFSIFYSFKPWLKKRLEGN